MAVKLCCKRCDKKVDVVTKAEYIAKDGFLFCNIQCYNNRFIPMDLSKPDRKKQNKKKPAYLVVVEDNSEYLKIRDELGFRVNTMEVIILPLKYKENHYLYTWFNRSYRAYAIKRIDYRVEVSDDTKKTIEDIKRLSNVKH